MKNIQGTGGIHAGKRMWDGIIIDDFQTDMNVEEQELGEYNKEKVAIFAANTNYERQLLKLSDSLKTAERRILYSMYLAKAFPKTKPKKCNSIIGETMKFHAHSDMSIYTTLVGMAQEWKKPAPLIDGKGNYGNAAHPKTFAHSRYTEAVLSEYAYECFFDDFDPDCVEVELNTASDQYIPRALPAKYPNILVNGGVGIAMGNSFAVPPYNINDIVDMCHKLIKDPDYSKVFMVPDLPTGVDVVDDGNNLRDICETGMGTLKMRSTIEIEESNRNWILKVKNIPWFTALDTINDKITVLTKSGKLPVKDVQNHSYQVIDNKTGNMKMIIDYRIIIDKAHDPNIVRAKLYKNTELEKSMAINFKVVSNELKAVTLNMKELILSWLDERREYKRRLLNKKISKTNSRLSLLEILIELLSKDNIEKTIKIIKNSNRSELIDSLVKKYGMNTYQATQIAGMRLNAFTKDARDEYIKERNKLEKDLKEMMELVRSEKKIDNIIIDELESLKKYGHPRRSSVVSADSNLKISNTDHLLIITKKGLIKKLPYKGENYDKATGYGSFAQYDYPIHRLVVNNHDSVMLFDSNGRYSCIPVHEIENTESSNPGNKIYNFTKLEGEIVSAYEYINRDMQDTVKDITNQTINIVTLSANGMIKKTDINEFTSLKSTKNVKAIRLKDDDKLAYAGLMFDTTKLLIYTKKGQFAFIKCDDIPLTSKDAIGNIAINLDSDDECVGCTSVGNDAEYLLVITEKGCAKKCEMEYLGDTKKRRQSSYITTLDHNDNVIYCDTITDESRVIVSTRTNYHVFNADDIRTASRKSKCNKLIPLPVGDNIVKVIIGE